MNITSHSVQKITAEAISHDGTYWIELIIHERSPGARLVLFFDAQQAKSEAYAAAINGVNELADAAIEPPQPVDDGGCDPLFGIRMDSADMGEC